MSDSALIVVLVICAALMALAVAALLYVVWLEVVDPQLTLPSREPGSTG